MDAQDEGEMDLLSDVLSQLRFRGTLYFRTSFTSPWGVRVPAYDQVARFHLVHRGNCLIRIEGVDQLIPLSQGDLIVVTKGARHTLFCDPVREDEALPLEDVVERSGFSGSGALVYGGEPGTNNETQLVCGHFAFDSDARHPLIDALPPYVHLTSYADRSDGWLEHTIRMIGSEAGRDLPGGDIIALKLAEIIFAQALRAYLSTADAPGLAGFADPRLTRALTSLHAEPSRDWTLDELASAAGMSRTAFAEKFAESMSVTPMAYLTRWRMLLARARLRDTPEPVPAIAEEVGYRSEAAFGRAFKKIFGVPPARYRRQHLNG